MGRLAFAALAAASSMMLSPDRLDPEPFVYRSTISREERQRRTQAKKRAKKSRKK